MNGKYTYPISMPRSGGYGNCSLGQFSAIGGGQNSDDGGLTGIMIVGNDITAVNPNTLHINGLWANTMCGPYTTVPLLPPGTVYYGPAGVPLANVLYIV